MAQIFISSLNLHTNQSIHWQKERTVMQQINHLNTKNVH